MSASQDTERLTYFSSFPFAWEFIGWSLPVALVTASISSSFVAAPVSETVSYKKLHSELIYKTQSITVLDLSSRVVWDILP